MTGFGRWGWTTREAATIETPRGMRLLIIVSFYGRQQGISVGSTVVIWMATEDREAMEARGAGESCPTLSKVAPGDNSPEGKSKASL
ncbi:hypothetical protein STEG23_021103, partial [Scotinomys teguina]